MKRRRICSTDVEYAEKAVEYTEYLVARGHDISDINKAFQDTSSITRKDARLSKVKNNRKSVIFSSQFNPRGPDVQKIIKKHSYLVFDTPSLKEIFKPGDIVVANKRGQNLRELLTRADPYSIKSEVNDTQEHGYKKCNKTCDL